MLSPVSWLLFPDVAPVPLLLPVPLEDKLPYPIFWDRLSTPNFPALYIPPAIPPATPPATFPKLDPIASPVGPKTLPARPPAIPPKSAPPFIPSRVPEAICPPPLATVPAVETPFPKVLVAIVNPAIAVVNPAAPALSASLAESVGLPVNKDVARLGIDIIKYAKIKTTHINVILEWTFELIKTNLFKISSDNKSNIFKIHNFIEHPTIVFNTFV